jgi:hypothetical protein
MQVAVYNIEGKINKFIRKKWSSNMYLSTNNIEIINDKRIGYIMRARLNHVNLVIMDHYYSLLWIINGGPTACIGLTLLQPARKILLQPARYVNFKYSSTSL